MKNGRTLLFSFLTLAILFSGCSKPEKKKLVMNTEAMFPPYEYYHEKKIVGIDPEIIAKIAEKLGFELEIADTGFDHIIDNVAAGRADIGASALTITPERQKKVDFTIPYAVTRQVVAVPLDSSITSFAELKGKLVGVQRGSTGCDFVIGKLGAAVKFPTIVQLLDALDAGKLDAVVADETPVQVSVAQRKRLKILPIELVREEYGFALGKGNPELLGQFNECIREMREDGTLAEIEKKHFQRQLAAQQSQISQRPLFRAAIDPFNPPNEYSHDGKICGVIPDVLQLFAQKKGYELVLEQADFSMLFAAISSGAADIGSASTAITPARLKVVDFSIPYEEAKQLVLLPAASPITDFSQLKGKKIGVIYSSQTDVYAAKNFGEPERYTSIEEMFADFFAQKLDALFLDEGPAEVLLTHRKEYRKLAFSPFSEKHGFILRKGNDKLKQELDEFLMQCQKDGTIGKLREKHRKLAVTALESKKSK